ncbi:MAG: DinB family protein [Flavobacterium sp.]|uniref:DinB family protein n=1 Tax=Flavobacterium sp. TaxID=239 RepID=UPI0032647CCC
MIEEVQFAIEEFAEILNEIPAILFSIKEEDMVFAKNETQWSKKQIIGHLIDSACNNHQRFIRTQYENIPLISYDQNKWNQYGCYTEAATKNLIDLFIAYNLHLLIIMRGIDNEKLLLKCSTGGEINLTLGFMIIDYVAHLKHHICQILPG